MSGSGERYAQFRAQRDRLNGLLREGREGFNQLDMTSWADTCDRLSERLASERFKVIVLGEFKRGKSTFINSLLGREVLPAFATPCTAIINELRWSDEPTAVLHFRNPPVERLPAGLAEEAVRHIEAHRGGEIPPLQVPVDQLERYVVIPDPTRDQSASIAETPYDRAELGWPLDLLRNSVEIIDSPGLNEHGSRTKVTMDYLGRIDAVIFVLSVHALASQTELGVIDRELRGSGHEYLFFVCNRFDELKRASDRDRITQYAYEHLAPRTSLGREGVFFVSALDAVIGREENDPALIERSRIPVVERALADFLVEHRGRIKLLQPSYQLIQGLKTALFETIPNRRRMLETSLGELEERVREARPQLEEAERRKRRTLESLERSRVRLRDAVRDAAANHLRSVADEVPEWALSTDIDSRISVFRFWAVEEQIRGVAEEVIAKVNPQIEQRTLRWQEDRLRPMIADHLADFQSDAAEAMKDFLVDMDGIRKRLTGDAASDVLPETRVGAVERVLAGVGGFFLGGAGSAIEGATMGYQGMLRSLLPSIAVVVGAVAILHLNPITIIPALIATSVFRSFRAGDALTAKAKGEIGKGLKAKIIESIPEQSRTIADKVDGITEPMIAAIEASMNLELETVRQQVESVLEVQRSGAAEIGKEQRQIAEIEEGLRSIEHRASEFVRELVDLG